MDETYTYRNVDYKRANGVWVLRVAGSVHWWPLLDKGKAEMLDALHPAPPPQVTLGGITYERPDDSGRWAIDYGPYVSYAMGAALDRIVELGGADV